MTAPRSMTLPFDTGQIAQIAGEFDLRAPNTAALTSLIRTLSQDYDPTVPQVLNLSTGAGKTYVMAAFIEYLRRHGHRHVMVVTPSLVVQSKTIDNFTPGNKRYIAGSPVTAEIITPANRTGWRMNLSGQIAMSADMTGGSSLDASTVFVFNVQQLVAREMSKLDRFEESSGNLLDALRDLDDLVVIADESHLYGESAKAFRAAITGLSPAAIVGLTASPDPGDEIIHTYPLYQSILDGHVKTPVLVTRDSGYENQRAPEEQHLRDALAILRAKQQAYADYAASHPEVKPTNAVLFVVCASVEHATSIADLLRSPSMLGSDDAVLQVDNEHDDEGTRNALDTLDEPDSPVRAVVSVNKLKEGWDVRNIAVMATLRAMASEVLTQQTMGRGLRLPFGTITGVDMVDELDIISHESFVSLLNTEGVLRTFGIESGTRGGHATGRPGSEAGPASDSRGDESVTSRGGEDTPTGHDEEQRGSHHTSGTGSRSVDGTGGAVRHRSIPDDVDLDDDPAVEDEQYVVQINDGFAGTVFQFPCSTMREVTDEFSLASIDTASISEHARRVTDTSDALVRLAIATTKGRTMLTTHRVTDAEVDSPPLPDEDVCTLLCAEAAAVQDIKRSPENIAQISRRIVPTLMKDAPVASGAWTEKSAASAVSEVQSMIRTAVREHATTTRTQITIHPTALPVHTQYTLPRGTQVCDREAVACDRHQFDSRTFYEGWTRNLFTAARMDSYAAEFKIAELLNFSPRIVWWTRLYRTDPAYIAYTPISTYYPDFVALDTDGVYWIIEGKDTRGRDDGTVQAKRRAAQFTINTLVGHESYADQRWGYLIAYQDDVQSSTSWDDLRAKSGPEVMP